LLDQLEGAAEHVSQRVNLAVVGKAPLQRILAFAGERGWRRLRLLSSARTIYNREYFAETAEGHQQPMLNVFHRDGRRSATFGARSFLRTNRARARSPPRRHHRAALEPARPHPRGRGTDWDEQLSY
jgi:predicted dithiol-disulfide oxidoreductase (DUF899 family)